MNLESTIRMGRRRSILTAILIGGAVAGTLDLIQAFYSFGWAVPRAIAGGLLGPGALHGGTGIWIFGVVLHFVIAFGAASIYCMASWKLDFLRQNFLVCGLFYGIAVHLVMNLVVLPLSAYHAKGPFEYRAMVLGLVVHMVLIGLPIAFSLNKFSK